MRGEIEGLGSIPKKIEGCEKIVVTVGFFVVIENFSSEALLGRLRKVKFASLLFCTSVSCLWNYSFCRKSMHSSIKISFVVILICLDVGRLQFQFWNVILFHASICLFCNWSLTFRFTVFCMFTISWVMLFYFPLYALLCNLSQRWWMILVILCFFESMFAHSTELTYKTQNLVACN